MSGKKPPLAASDLGLNQIFRISVLLICFLAFISVSKAQNNSIESLTIALSEAKHDTTRVKLLNSLAREYRKTNPDTAFVLAKKATEMAQKSGQKNQLAIANNTLGLIYANKGGYLNAIEHYSKSIKIYEETKDILGLASVYNNIGNVYKEKGDLDKSLSYYLKCLKIEEDMNDRSGMASSYNNIGIIYSDKKEHTKAMDYYQRSLKIREESGNKRGISHVYNSIGSVHHVSGEHDKALDFYFKSLKLREELNDKRGIASSTNNIGAVFVEKGELAENSNNKSLAAENYQQAIDYYFQSLKIREEMGDKNGIALSYNNIGNLLLKQGKLTEAHEYQKKALAIAQEINSKPQIMYAYNSLALTDSASNNFKDAYLNYKRYISIRDSIYSEESEKNIIQSELKFEYEKKETIARIEYEKQRTLSLLEIEKRQMQLDRTQQDLLLLERDNELKKMLIEKSEEELRVQKISSEFQKKALELLETDKKLKETELHKQRILAYSAIGGSGIFMLLLLLAVKAYRSKQRANNLIKQQKEEVEKQKALVDEKNKNITDSINYARNIQQAILPYEERIKNFLPEFFVFYQPKDIVSGDFYWFNEKNGKIFLAVVDCTGHGVPGAFMSMIGSAVLNHLVIEKQITDPDHILNEMHKDVRLALKQSESNNRDGMDLGIVVIDNATRTMQFAGANMPLYLVENNEFKIIKGNKFSVGGLQTETERVFTKHIIDFKNPLKFYLSSDGYQDQFGGEQGKKFKTSRFKELLNTIHSQSIPEQSKNIMQTFHNWKGYLEQVDDVCVIGVNIK
jgi:serine phosphatase RsbU (regulator of sigma subunit)